MTPPPPLLCHLMLSKGQNSLGHVTLQHVALTNRFMYTEEFTTSLHNRILLFTQVAQNHFEFVWLILKIKIFPVILQNAQWNFLLGQLVPTYCCNLSPKLYTTNGLSSQLVEATYCPVCSDLYITANSINLVSQFLAFVTVNL